MNNRLNSKKLKRSWQVYSESTHKISKLFPSYILSVYRLALEREKPEVAQINKNIERYKQQQVEDMAVLSENMEAVQSHKAEKRELKIQVVCVLFTSLNENILNLQYIV